MGRNRGHTSRVPTIFQGEELVPVNKICYTEHPNVSNRTMNECEKIWLNNSIHVTCKETTRKPRPIVTLDEAPFPDAFMDTLREQGITTPSPIQVQAWPTALWGYDFIAVAETGSGKTLAYVLPMLFHIQKQVALRPSEGPIGLVLVPNRELCQQVLDTVNLFKAHTGFTAAALTGGENEQVQVKTLLGRVEIVAACPGRLLDLLKKKQTNLKRTSFIVFDEADELFRGNFEVQVKELMSMIREDRQVLLFSATWPEQVERISAEVCIYEPSIIVAGSTTLAACKDITQVISVVGSKDSPTGWDTYKKIDALCEVLARVRGHKVLVFCNAKETVTDVVKNLQTKGFPSEGFSSECFEGRRAETRAERLKRFADPDSNLSVLVCTQVLGRGHDFKGLRMVINYDMPEKLVEYVHRIGRTGRAGRKGIAITLLEEEDLRLAKPLKAVLKATDQVVHPWLEVAAKGYRPWKKPVTSARVEPKVPAAPHSLERISQARDKVLTSMAGTGIARIRGYV